MFNWLGREFWVALRSDFMKCVRYCERQVGDIDRKQRLEMGVKPKINSRHVSNKSKVWN